MYKDMESVLDALKTNKTSKSNVNKTISRYIAKCDVEKALMFYEAKIRFKIWESNGET